MNESKISVRYAKALFSSALEDQILEEVMEDIKLVQSSLEIKGFKEYLESPVIKTSSKSELVRKVFKERISGLSMNFFELLLSKNREDYLGSIIRNFISLYREEKGIKSASLKIPFQVSDKNRKKFISLLENTYKSKIEMEEKLDTELIGGFILTVEDEQFDASIKTGLAKIKKHLLRTPIKN